MKTNQDNKCIYSDNCEDYHAGYCSNPKAYNGDDLNWQSCEKMWEKRLRNIAVEKWPHLRY